MCETNGGVWWGPSDHPAGDVLKILGDQANQGLPSCCAVQRAIADAEIPEIEEIEIAALER